MGRMHMMVRLSKPGHDEEQSGRRPEMSRFTSRTAELAEDSPAALRNFPRSKSNNRHPIGG